MIVGPTASGKTSLAIRLARRFKGEIVSADSRLLYEGMDIGTAKPSAAERGGISHYLIDVVRPDRTLTAAEYKDKALNAIGGILKKGRLPIVVGGTGLYIQMIVDNLEIPKVPPDPEYRRHLERLPRPELFRRLKKQDPDYAARIGPNPRYAIRALEAIHATGKPFSRIQGRGEPLFNVLQIGLKIPKRELERRIKVRTIDMFRRGLLDEAKRLAKRYDWNLPAMSGIGYRELQGVLEGEIAPEVAMEAIRLHTRQYAKRQMTWFKRDRRIRWISRPKAASAMVKNWLK